MNMADSGTQDQSTIVSVQGEDVQIFTRLFAAIIQNITTKYTNNLSTSLTKMLKIKKDTLLVAQKE